MKKYLEISELNKNSNLLYKIKEKSTKIIEKTEKTFEKVNNYMSLDFYIPSLKERKQILKFYGFPTDESKSVLASYYTTLPKESIFGIEIGTEVGKAEEILLSYGYTKNEKNFKKGVIEIELTSYENKILSFKISLESQYLGNRLY